jgi:hypothetical protein
MSDTDPWALPQSTGGPGSAGIPAAPYQPPLSPAQPLNRKLPFVVLGFGAAYVVVSVVQIFALGSRVSLVNQALGGADITLAQANSADNLVSGISWAALVVFLGTLIAIRSWQRSLTAAFGPQARKDVFARAGYVYFRATWLISIFLSVALNFGTNGLTDQSPQQVISHDHEFMVYYGLRALVGIVLLVFALRLKKISEAAETRPLAGA